MSIICSICGGTDVKCAAVIDPNTKQFLDFGYEAFLDGERSRCGNVALTDPDEVKTDMDRLWAEYVARHHTAPNYARCDIVRHGDYDGCEGACIRIGGPKNAVEKYPVVTVCRDLKELKALTEPDPEREFTVVECLLFEFYGVMENKTYNIEAGDRPVSVTTKEVLEFYPAEYGLKETDIERYAAAYTARIKTYRECDRWLDPAFVRRLLDEEHLMKPRESDSFRLRLHFDWFATLRREDERLYAPSKYAVKAYCLDNAQTFGRRYTSLEKALLHCLNGFNENANVPDRYKSIEEYLSKHS